MDCRSTNKVATIRGPRHGATQRPKFVSTCRGAPPVVGTTHELYRNVWFSVLTSELLNRLTQCTIRRELEDSSRHPQSVSEGNHRGQGR